MSRRPDPLTPWYDIMRPEGPIQPHEAKERYVHRPHVEEQIWRLAADRSDRKPVILVEGVGRAGRRCFGTSTTSRVASGGTT